MVLKNPDASVKKITSPFVWFWWIFLPPGEFFPAIVSIKFEIVQKQIIFTESLLQLLVNRRSMNLRCKQFNDQWNDEEIQAGTEKKFTPKPVKNHGIASGFYRYSLGIRAGAYVLKTAGIMKEQFIDYSPYSSELVSCDLFAKLKLAFCEIRFQSINDIKENSDRASSDN